jgi:hypothetical protein
MDTDQPGTEEVPQQRSIEAQFTLNILQIIKGAQSQHGLKHGDYGRYRCVPQRASCCVQCCRMLKYTTHCAGYTALGDLRACIRP